MWATSTERQIFFLQILDCKLMHNCKSFGEIFTFLVQTNSIQMERDGG